MARVKDKARSPEAAAASPATKRHKTDVKITASSSRPRRSGRSATAPSPGPTRSSTSNTSPSPEVDTRPLKKGIAFKKKGIAVKKKGIAVKKTAKPSPKTKRSNPTPEKASDTTPKVLLTNDNAPEAAEEPQELETEDGHKANDEDNAPADEPSFWLMKAEPESRIEKGTDVKFSIDDLEAAKEPEGWDGNYFNSRELERADSNDSYQVFVTLSVRKCDGKPRLSIKLRPFKARNNMRMMMKGDLAFFYHSNCKTPGIVGTMEIVQEHSVDGNLLRTSVLLHCINFLSETAFDPASPYYDAKSDREKPRWCLVHVEFRQKFPELITLKELQKYAKEGGVLENMQTLKQSRLSVSKVSKKEWEYVM